MFNIQRLKEKITEEDIKNILEEYNTFPVNETDNVIIFPTVCHNLNPQEASPKLYYYKDSKMFYCFTECNKSYDIIELVLTIEKLHGNNYSFFEIVEKIKEKVHFVEDFYESNLYQVYESQQEYYNKKPAKINYEFYNKDIMNFFQEYLPYEWAKDGIILPEMRKYDIKYYPAENQVIIPHYDINKNLVGIRIRALNKDDILKGKYRPLRLENKIYSHPLSQFCYGLWNNKENINKTKQAIIVEGEKSVLLGEQLECNNLVACCGSNISKTQIMQLIKCGAKEIVIAFDKEYITTKSYKSEKYYNKLYELANKYKLYCNMSFIFDFWNKLEEKDSPIDKGVDNFICLLEKRIKLYE